jgi:ATP-dependent Clp protease ATP-binding subunit ClpC
MELSAGASRILREAKQRASQEAQGISLKVLFLALARHHHRLLARLSPEVDVSEQVTRYEAAIASGDAGPFVKEPDLVASARKVAQERDAERIYEKDLAVVVLKELGHEVQLPEEQDDASRVERARGGDPLEAKLARRSTPLLSRLGRDLTQAARDGKLQPVLCRDKEIEDVIRVLGRRERRNPLLVGPAGVGKTAIVEGLAQRIVSGEVPEFLRGQTIVELTPLALTAGLRAGDDYSRRMKEVIQEASQPGLILFMDEIHNLVGGTLGGLLALEEHWKPALARGELAVIGATTDLEYEEHIRTEEALERRFTTIRIQELNPEQAYEILRERPSDVQWGENALREAIAISSRVFPNRRLPDRAIEFMDHCVAEAKILGKDVVEKQDILHLATRLTGVSWMAPDAREACLQRLVQHLPERVPISRQDVEALRSRLQVTMAQLDMRAERPNAIILTTGDELEGLALAEELAEILYDTRERLIQEDCAQYQDSFAPTWLVGSPPGYVGYDDVPQLYRRLNQSPWSVLVLRHVDALRPAAQNLLAEVLDRGVLRDARGRRAFLPDSVVVMTTSGGDRSRLSAPVGFRRGEGERQGEREAPPVQSELLEVADLVISLSPPDEDWIRNWLARIGLPTVQRAYAQRDLRVEWEATFVEELARTIYHAKTTARRSWERMVEEKVAGAVLGKLDLEAMRDQVVLLRRLGEAVLVKRQ